MSIQGSLNACRDNLYAAANYAGSAVKQGFNKVVEQGKLGYNTTVKAISDNPRTTAVTALAVTVIALGAAYAMSASEKAPQ